MSALDLFRYDDHDVRTRVIDDEPCILLADICAVLGMKSSPSQVAQRLPGGVQKTDPLETAGGTQNATWVTEAGFYRVVLRSNSPKAEPFIAWVTEDVLPTLRRTGRYGSDAATLASLPSSQLLSLAAEAAKRAEESEAALAIAAPKADAYDAFIDGDGTYSVGAVAKMLGLSQNKLFDELRGAGVLISKGAMRNTPYQHYMHHFAVKAFEFERSNGDRGTSYTTRVLPSGVDFIRRKLGLSLVSPSP